MGAWGAAAFANDDASDWVYDLEEDTTGQVVRTALQLPIDGYVEAPDGAAAIAAAEVVAAAQGKPASDLPEEVGQWVAQYGERLGASDVAAAIAALDRVSADGSELKELWDEAEDTEWSDSVRELRQRLSSTGES